MMGKGHQSEGSKNTNDWREQRDVKYGDKQNESLALMMGSYAERLVGSTLEGFAKRDPHLKNPCRSRSVDMS